MHVKTYIRKYYDTYANGYKLTKYPSEINNRIYIGKHKRKLM